MKNSVRTFALIGLTALLAAFVATPASAAEKKDGEKKARPLPYAGTVKTVDRVGKQVTLATKTKTRTFEITAETKISKSGAPATLDDVKPDEEARVSYVEKDGKFIAHSLLLGAKEGAAPKGKKKGEEKK